MNSLSRSVAKRTAATTNRDNRGFSLVELIIVIAIMAVLTAILAPQLIRYIERARAQKDKTNASEVYRAVQLAVADEKVYGTLVTDTTVTVTGSSGAIAGTASADLLDEVRLTCTGMPPFTSNEHKGQTYTITITVGTNGVVTLSDGWS